MPAAIRPKLKAGKVYRTSELARFGTNPPRIAKRLVSEGQLRPLAHGLFVHPEISKFGEVPPILGGARSDSSQPRHLPVVYGHALLRSVSDPDIEQSSKEEPGVGSNRN